MKFDINLDKIPVLEKKGGQFYVTDKAKDALVQIIQMEKEAVDKFKAAKDKIKHRIIAAGQRELGDNFAAVKSADKSLSISYYDSGTRYVGNPSDVSHYYKKKVESLDPEAIDRYLEKNGALPAGVHFNAERKKTTRITYNAPE